MARVAVSNDVQIGGHQARKSSSRRSRSAGVS
jgi:hypothetical protein